MDNLFQKIALQSYINYSGNITEARVLKTAYEVIKQLPENEILKYLNEARDNNYAAYEVKKDRVIAKVAAQKASVFTSLAKSWDDLDKKVKQLEEKKRELNALKNDVEATEKEVHQKIKDKIISMFDDSEKTMTLVVECLNSSFTLSKETEANQDKVINKQGDIISTDYKKVVELLLEQNQDLKGTIDNLIKQASVIAAADVIKPGAKRRLSVDVTTENVLNEDIVGRVFNALSKLGNYVKLYLKKLNSRQNLINNSLQKLII